MFNKFKKDDFVFIHCSEGEGIGNFEVNKIKNVTPETMELKYPLNHTYKDGFQNNSQVIKIPQYSTVNIEKDVFLFHKALKEGCGGVIVLMANSGFTIKGYIVDPVAKVEAFDLTNDEKIKKSNGVIFGLANYDGNIARKVFDIKFTTRYPTITLPQDQKITVLNSKKEYEAGKFQHITIPPDLNLHLTDERKRKDYLFFKPEKLLIAENGSLAVEYIKLITVTYPSINQCPIFTNKKYTAGLMVAFAKMSHWNMQSHYKIELFAIRDEDTRVPKEAHNQGELGVFPPFPVFYTDNSSGQTIKYYLKLFTILCHLHEKPIQVKFW